eukprot:1628923-Rhodomonas_salina.3
MDSTRAVTRRMRTPQAASIPDGYKRLPVVILADKSKEEMNRVLAEGLEGYSIQVLCEINCIPGTKCTKNVLASI